MAADHLSTSNITTTTDGAKTGEPPPVLKTAQQKRTRRGKDRKQKQKRGNKNRIEETKSVITITGTKNRETRKE
jgi:hypothetical protein